MSKPNKDWTEHLFELPAKYSSPHVVQFSNGKYGVRKIRTQFIVLFLLLFICPIIPIVWWVMDWMLDASSKIWLMDGRSIVWAYRCNDGDDWSYFVGHSDVFKTDSLKEAKEYCKKPSRFGKVVDD